MREDEHNVRDPAPTEKHSKIRFIRFAFSGPKFCGKDTIVKRLKEEYGFAVFSFSDQLKVVACEQFPFMPLDYPSEEKETLVVYKNQETGKEYTPRDIWQALDLLPTIYPDVYIRRVHKQIDTYVDRMSNLGAGELRICIKDVRRPAELAYVVRQGYWLTLIDTDDTRSRNEKANHISESFYEDIRRAAKTTFFNSKSDPEYEKKIEQLIAKLLQEESGNGLADQWLEIKKDFGAGKVR
jgi:hypothetical protein